MEPQREPEPTLRFESSPIAGELTTQLLNSAPVLRPVDSWESFNLLLNYGRLRNQFYLLRHGFSTANQLMIDSGSPESGKDTYVLTGPGREEITTNIMTARADSRLGSDTIIYCSEFLRCRESADIAAKLLGVEKFTIDSRLNERGSGEFEGSQLNEEEQKQRHELFKKLDKADPFHEYGGVESPVAVMRRVSAIVRELELSYNNRTILLISHHDAIQILRVAFRQPPPGLYQDLEPLRHGILTRLD